MMCELIDVTDRDYTRKHVQDLIFFIGPRKGQFLSTDADFDARMEDVRRLFQIDLADTSGIESLLVVGLSKQIQKVVAERTSGGMRGTFCPNLRIDAYESEVLGGGAFVSRINKAGVLAMCAYLRETLDAEWIDAWYYGHFSNVPNFQVQYPTPLSESP